MRSTKFTLTQSIPLLVLLLFIMSCEQNTQKQELDNTSDLATLEKETESRLREYKNHLKNGDSVALGNMYMVNAKLSRLLLAERI